MITVRYGDFSGLAGLRREAEGNPDYLRLGPYAVMHATADHVVDSYLDVTQLMETDIDTMEEEIFAAHGKFDIEQIYLLKREIVELRQAISPLSSALQRITSEHQDLISTEVIRYLRGMIDHQTEAADRITSYDEC